MAYDHNERSISVEDYAAYRNGFDTEPDAELESVHNAIATLATKIVSVEQSACARVQSLNVRMHSNGAVSISANVKVSRYLGASRKENQNV